MTEGVYCYVIINFSNADVIFNLPWWLHRVPSLRLVTETTNRTICVSIYITFQPCDSLLGGVEPSHHHGELCFLIFFGWNPYGSHIQCLSDMIVRWWVSQFLVMCWKMLTCHTSIFARRIWLRTFSSSCHRVIMFIYLVQSEWSQ
jgi:hypothetical protein